MSPPFYGPGEAVEAIWVVLEENDGQLANVSLELLSRGRLLADKMGWSLVGLLIVGEITPELTTAVEYRVDELILMESPLLKPFTVEGHAAAAYQAIRAMRPAAVIFGATINGRDLAGRLAVRLRTGLNADCTEIDIDADTGVLICQVSGFGGGILALIETPTHRPQMATIRPGVYEQVETSRSWRCKISQVLVDIPQGLIRTTVVSRSRGEGPDLTRSDVIVAGGRGIAHRIDLLSDLASLLGGEVGATRPLVDDGLIERERQIGQTGVVSRPNLAIACGVSGAFHFLVGIEKAGTVIAINLDPGAPIFDHADYFAVVDAEEIIEKIIDIIAHYRNEEPLVIGERERK